MTKAEKKRRIDEVTLRLKSIYPDAECALEYGGDPWRLLVMARLSAQCTDARVNIVSRELFLRFPTARAMADGELSEIEQIIKPCGLYKMKAKNLKDSSAELCDKYGGKLPDTMEELLTLSGVGRKIANLLLGDIFGKSAVVCDTHCMRICARLGMYPQALKNPTKIEYILKELLDPEESSDFCHRIVMFGRDYCTARSPQCCRCPIFDLCRYKEKKDENCGKEKGKIAYNS